ncbi:GIY-YIG nuclease family protein [Halomonas colorata]|uniref:GIY-YIG nuclease family protein n=1 Tax=Halomonas colorata TaxID=2742615 RepID=A0ABR9G1U8_9GAMM|nr:GIY-YIG nuclease family protein [Halomonas colorata]MBE0464860.1 GIY-YIG nuclease family protein [Halomonas colorata]
MPPINHNRKKASTRPSLDDVFASPDEFGLLDVEAKKSSSGAPLEVSRFEEICAFVDQQGRAPQAEGRDLQEKLLARRLKSYAEKQDLLSALKPHDRHNLLSEPALASNQEATAHNEEAPSRAPTEPRRPASKMDVNQTENVTSLDDILSSDAFSEFDQGEDSLFDPVHVSFEKNREEPDEIAQRRVCLDFYAFKPIFKELHEKLKTGDVKAARFQQASQVQPGDAFILEGVMCLVDEVGEYREDNQGRYDPRLRIIFENGTESNHLLQSLAKRLYQEPTGRRIIRDSESVVDAFNNVNHKDKRAGQIYFVTTLSDKPALREIPSLLKIGYTELTVDERTKNAERDTAFLEAPVKKLASIECYNLNPNKFETLIHGFLHAQRIKMTLTGRDGKEYHPREWFSVPLDTAREVVKRIIDGSIVQYRMDNTTGRLVKKKV